MKSCEWSAPNLPPARYALLVLPHPWRHGEDGLGLEGKEELLPRSWPGCGAHPLVSVWRSTRCVVAVGGGDVVHDRAPFLVRPTSIDERKWAGAQATASSSRRWPSLTADLVDALARRAAPEPLPSKARAVHPR